MKNVIVFLAVVLLYSCMKSTDQTKFDQLWSALLTASTADAERLAVDELRAYLSDTEVSYSIYGIDKESNRHDVQDASFDDKKLAIASYELHVRQEGSDIIGKGWKPKEKEYVYNFFLE